MRGVRALAMGDAEAVDLAGQQVDQVEPRGRRGKREIDHADRVAIADRGAVAGQRGLGPLEQLRIDPRQRRKGAATAARPGIGGASPLSGIPTGLAAEEIIRPPAPIAPIRNNSRRSIMPARSQK